MTGFAQNPATQWIREAVILAAECAIRTPVDSPIRPREGWPDTAAQGAKARWKFLRAEARNIEQQDLVSGMARLEYWLIAALSASELYPDVAAAFSILAESERLALPTPASFARLAVAGLDAAYDEAIAAVLCGTSSHLVERIEPSGAQLPLAQCGLRLRPEAAGILFGADNPVPAEIEVIADEPIFASQASVANIILDQDNGVWIRARTRRLGRQLALDIATKRNQKAAFFILRDENVPLSTDRYSGIVILDLFSLDRPPQLTQNAAQPQIIVAPWRFEHPAFRAVDAPELQTGDVEAIWQNAPLGGADRAYLARKFQLTLPELRASLREAETAKVIAARGTINGGMTLDLQSVSDAIRAEGARRMGSSVSVVKSDVTLDDLVTTASMRAQLDDAVAWRKNSERVWGEMGIPSDEADAKGLSMLFSGPPGGGKTFAARCLANALELNLYRIDLSQVVSKYIGETEKALARIFDEAEAGHGALFFDEADAIFGKRSEVKDAHDRYANIEVGFLLQRMESFDGVMIMATNLRANLDPAFLRRIRFIIDFPLPSKSERHTLWTRNLPAKDWYDPDLDIDMLATNFRLSGGSIRNTAVAAAHLAAAHRKPVGPDHIAKALYRELEKVGLPRAASDLGPLAEHLEAYQ